MGIPCYFNKLIRKYPNILNKYHNIYVDDFYLDCNSIIYDIVHEIEEKTNENIAKHVIYKLEEYINTIQAKNSVMIAFDGVAPNAKLHQQRERRYKSYITNKTFSVEKWNTCQITPGTKFMKYLMNEIEMNFKDNNKVHISSSNIPGEGEHKIFNKIRESHNKIVMVYGIDADLIMLCLSNKSYCDKIILFRETPFFIKNINKNIEPNELYYIDITNLSLAIDTTLNKKNSELDYILLMFFLGNDFMPHFPSLNIRTTGMDTLIDSYKFCLDNNKFFSLVNEEKEINWFNLNLLIKYLNQYERENIVYHQEKKSRVKRNMSDSSEIELQNRYLNIPTQLRNIEYIIDANKDGWELRYYSILLNIEDDENNFFVKKLCHNYYKTLQWTLKYYTSKCIDWTWTFDYSYPPLLKDLVDYNHKSYEFKQNTKAIEPNEQLNYVIPPDSLHLLDNKFKNNKLRETTIHYNWAYCKYIWEGHIDFL